jgi:hypothetical protein
MVIRDGLPGHQPVRRFCHRLSFGPDVGPQTLTASGSSRGPSTRRAV